jgi:hypothetical protein
MGLIMFGTVLAFILRVGSTTDDVDKRIGSHVVQLIARINELVVASVVLRMTWINGLVVA